MANSNNTEISSGGTTDGPNVPSIATRSDSLDLDRLARLVAGGEVEWPDGLSDRQADELTALVRRRRRSELITMIARAIAAELAGSRKVESQ
jgi:hypothetical protein